MRGFGDLETVIMDRVWAHDAPVTVRDLFAELSEERDIAYTTVMSTMDNLHRKGWLARERDGKAYRYTAVNSREEYSAGLMREAMAGVADTEAVLSHFVAQMDDAESTALRAILDKLARPAAVTAALALLGYAAVAGWCAPLLLTPLTSHGRSVRAGLAAWLAAMASVLLALGLGLGLALRTVAADWPQLTQALCRSVAGGVCTPAVYRSALYESTVTVLAAVATLLAAVALWRCGRRVQRARRQTRAHAETARIVGRGLASTTAAAGQAATRPRAAGHQAPTVVLDDPRPAVYCVAGRPPAIVVTSGALAVLDPAQLGAVLAHERAHLRQGHHWLATLTQGLTDAFPGVPLFPAGRDQVACLAEMAADDAAARQAGRPAVAQALLALATGGLTARPAPLPRPQARGTALAAAAFAVPARVERLLLPPRRATSAACTAALTLALLVLTAAPPALALLVTR